jgi:hypothetical protein
MLLAKYAMIHAQKTHIPNHFWTYAMHHIHLIVTLIKKLCHQMHRKIIKICWMIFQLKIKVKFNNKITRKLDYLFYFCTILLST